MEFSKLLTSSILKAQAAGDPGGLTDPLGGVGFVGVMNKVMSALLSLAVPIVGIMILIGGFQIMTAGGSSEKVQAGKKTITYAIVGFVIILMAKSAVLIVKSII